MPKGKTIELIQSPHSGIQQDRWNRPERPGSDGCCDITVGRRQISLFLVFVDVFTRYIELTPLHDQRAASLHGSLNGAGFFAATECRGDY